MGRQFVKARPNRRILAPHFDRYWAAAKFPNEIPFTINMNKPPDTGMHPSSKGDTLSCAREIYDIRSRSKYKGYWQGGPEHVKRTDDHSSQKNFAVGHMYHELHQFIMVEGLGFCDWKHIEDRHKVLSDGSEWSEENAIKVVGDGNWKGGWWGTGALDVSCCEVPKEGSFVVDFKTCGSRPFKMKTEPDAGYVAQMKLYLDWAHMERGIILYINKDSGHDYREFTVEADPAFAERVYETWDLAFEGLASGQRPECTCDSPAVCPANE